MTTDYMLPETVIRGVAFALRDLCEAQGGKSALITLEGRTDDVTVVYMPGEGARLITAGRSLSIPDAALDAVGYVPADPSSSKQQQITEGLTND